MARPPKGEGIYNVVVIGAGTAGASLKPSPARNASKPDRCPFAERLMSGFSDLTR